jgi:uncharacterized membrane protein HdeD (DUF308 family)
MLLRSWWVLVIRGVFAILFGVITLLWPDITVFALVTIFGAFVMLDGLIEIWVGFANRGRERHWWADALLGVVSVVIGVIAIGWPGITAIAAMYVIASWMIVIGGLMVYQGIRLRDDIAGELWVISTGALSFLLGVAFMIFPGAGAISLAWAIAGFIVVLGVLMVKIGWGIGRIERALQAEAMRQPHRAR